jgi:hypothetical protein
MRSNKLQSYNPRLQPKTLVVRLRSCMSIVDSFNWRRQGGMAPGRA